MTAKASREERRSERTAQIIDTAAQLFATRGYEATGIAELCDAVGLGRGALYHYIQSKEALLGLVHDQVADLILPAGRRIVGVDEDALTKLRRFGEHTIGVIVDHPDHVWVFMNERRALDRDLRERFRRQRDEYENLLAAILVQGRDEGTLAFDDLHLSVLAWFGMHNYTYQWVHSEARTDRREVASVFYRIFVDGVTAPRPA